MKVWEDGQAVDFFRKLNFVASDTLEKSSDANVHITSTTMAVRKSITFNPAARALLDTAELRIKFDLKSDDGLDHVNGRIYRNGVAYGTLRKCIDTNWENFSEDLADWEYNDTIELWANIDDVTHVGDLQNFRVYADIEEITYELAW